MKRDPFQKPQPNNKPKSIYNPDKEDFTASYANEDNTPAEYTLHAGEIETYPTYLADHIAKHLAHKLVTTRGIKTNYEDDIKEMLTIINTNL